MQNEENIWSGYFGLLQKSWLEMNQFWLSSLSSPLSSSMFSAFSLPMNKADDSGKDALSLFGKNWLSIFSPWMPRVEANIEPFLEEAARVSMRIFMPWNGGDSLWVEALVRKKNEEETKVPPAKKALPNKPPVQEVNVDEAIKRSKRQD
ncbi:MAG: hypothetical protein LBG69_02095 [Zoogloeaceae bacterium]|jgi:hypothetical protein|nr:hypothetical protein [Zoogloeaceae bacterium]